MKLQSIVKEFIQSPIRIGLLFCFLVFFPFPEFSEGLIFEPLSDAVHLLLGFCLFYFVRSIAPKYSSLSKDESCFLVAVLLLSLGLAGYIEYVQPIFGRGYSLHDMELSLFGSFCAYFLSEKKLPNRNLYFLISLVLGLLFAVLPVINGLRLAREKWSQFPILLKSNSILNETVKPLYAVDLESNVGPCAIMFKTESLFDGISIPRGREDWSGFDKLSIEFDNLTDSSGEIGLRIDDAIKSKNYYDRYNDKFYIVPGLNRIYVKLEDMKNAVQKREFALTKIRRIFLFSVKDKKELSICLRKIELHPAK